MDHRFLDSITNKNEYGYFSFWVANITERKLPQNTQKAQTILCYSVPSVAKNFRFEV